MMFAALPLLDASVWLQSFGPWVLLGVAAIIFIESGVLFPFLPGDSLLITAAIIAPGLGIEVWQIGVVAVIAAIAGDQAGYWLGHRYGRRLFKDEARVLRTEYLDRTQAFFHKYGPQSLVIGRFVPIVRTYVPLAAGIAAVSYRTFLPWNLIGAATWVVSMLLIGVTLGSIPFITHNIDILIITVVIVSTAPILIGALRQRRKGKKV